jgi:dTDP-4-dehydrorhamnose 3,5-epimerase
MNVSATSLAGVLLIEPRVFGDARGFFQETWQQARYAEAGIAGKFVQDNLSRSRRGVLRGLHFQQPNPQGKLVYVLEGEVYDVAVDIRRGSPSFGRAEGFSLSAENHRQLYIPPGFAHGFCVLSETALFAYKCTAPYDPACEATLRWDDSDLGIAWPIEAPELSDKDRGGLRLVEFPPERLPRYAD